MKIFELSEKLELLDEAIEYFWRRWGNESNYNFYEDCIKNSFQQENKIPKFYIGVKNAEIICSYALITNDLISRQDLVPWFACLYVNESERNNGIAEQLLDHGLEQSKMKGYQKLYLSTDLINYYERKGWNQDGFGYGFSGDKIKIYSKLT